MSEIHRNDPCPCGSGKKYKKCCGMSKAQKSAPGSLQGRITVQKAQAKVNSLMDKIQPMEMPLGSNPLDRIKKIQKDENNS